MPTFEREHINIFREKLKNISIINAIRGTFIDKNLSLKTKALKKQLPRAKISRSQNFVQKYIFRKHWEQGQHTKEEKTYQICTQTQHEVKDVMKDTSSYCENIRS